MKRARIIYNPTSGRELFKRHLPEALQILEEAGYETSCHATTGIGDATHAATLAAERSFDVVIAAGGDGTLNEVVNGLANFQGENRPTLGLIPVGTTNDFARAIGIPRDIAEACRVIAKGDHVPLDLGKVGDRYFINIAAGGKMTELTYEVPSKMKTVLGQLAYFIKGAEMLPRIRPVKITVETAEETFEEEAMLWLVANTKSVGGFEKLAPDASINDGLFDVIILKKTFLHEFVGIAAKTLAGEHLKHPSVRYFQTNKISITTSSEVPINLDGELGGQFPAVITMAHHHLEMIVPNCEQFTSAYVTEEIDTSLIEQLQQEVIETKDE